MTTTTDPGQPSPELGLSPAGELRLTRSVTGFPLKTDLLFGKKFQADWREGLFTLAAEKADPAGSPTIRYWRELAATYLTSLCHIPGETKSFEVDPPSLSDLASRVLKAPPMRGGEYLTPVVLLGVWQALDRWVHDAVSGDRGLEGFLKRRAPKWHRVGRVCFHLAENKGDDARPFAFMATYTAGFGAGNRLRHLPLRKALEEYAGARNRAALINLLAPVQRAAERCAWVDGLLESGEIYEPMAWSAEKAYRFLQTVPELEDSGLTVRLPDWWKKRPKPRVEVVIGQNRKAALGLDALLDFNVRVALGDEPVSREELARLLRGGDGLVLLKGRWVEVDPEKLREALDHWEGIRKRAGGDGLSFIEGMRLLAGAPADLRDKDRATSEEERAWVHVGAGDGLRAVLEALRDPGRLVGTKTGYAIRGELRPYQREGAAWLDFLTELGLGACLADDMGLGKTIQVLALLMTRRGEKKPRQRRMPSLLIVPASLLGNWRSEAARFAPRLKLVFLHPAETDRATLDRIAQSPAARLADADLVVTTYAMAVRQNWLTDVAWDLVILDEAQAIKNAATRQSKAVRQIPARARIVLTGTPIENRLGDLWSLFDFLNPGLLGPATVFKTFIKSLEARPDDQYAPLRRLVGPYILRRLKTDRTIIADLPEKTETPRYCTLTRPQVRLYEQTVRTMKKALASVDGIARRGLVLQTLMRLKQICNHPSQVRGDGDYAAVQSGKFIRLAEICEELAQRQEKVLVFTQFREMIDPLENHLARVFGREGLHLHGGTGVKRRKAIVDRFQEEDGPPFFVLSLKAGGTGLNLTAASHVIHFDRWWNPAVENQATDRAFRIGQKRNVFVHTFITQGTVEERIDTMIAEKRGLAENILAGQSEANLTELPDDELLDLVRLDITRAIP